MITHSFDPLSPATFSPEHIVTAIERPVERLLVTFSHDVLRHALKAYPCEEVATLTTLNGPRASYKLHHNGKEIAFVMSPITAAGSVTFLEQLRAQIGFTKLLVFGSCGALDSDLDEGRLILPTRAWRDEGLSYHYAEAADYIEVKNAPQMAAWMDELKVPYAMGPAWTTDALFRETRENVRRRKADGCIAVDMECSGLQAFCDYRGIDFYTFFYTGDQLDAPEWDIRILGNEKELDHQLSNFRLAIELLSRT